jgi:hypothetical protein
MLINEIFSQMTQIRFVMAGFSAYSILKVWKSFILQNFQIEQFNFLDNLEII